MKNTWTAKFKDGAILNRFDLLKQEILFQEVLDYDSELINFAISFVNTICSVNLIDGIFTVIQKNVPIRIFALDSDVHNKPTNLVYSLVYFRRHVEQLYERGPSRGGIQFVAIGWKATDENGQKIKRIVKIHANDMIEICE